MRYIKNGYNLVKNYLILPLLNQDSNARFWYLPEPINIYDENSLKKYLTHSSKSPFYLIDYRPKLQYQKQNSDGIIVLPYPEPTNEQINPEAAFQYALGLHDEYLVSDNEKYLKQFFIYVNYFVAKQSQEGDWHYQFDWYEAKAPWASALAQSRGASVMLRAWLLTGKEIYKNSALLALSKFNVPIAESGYLNRCKLENCDYYEEYPLFPTQVINGFIASLFGIWECKKWIENSAVDHLWERGIKSLKKMLPHYSYDGWTLYDLDKKYGLTNLNSPRYHDLMIRYIKLLSVIDDENFFKMYEQVWQSKNIFYFKSIALASKFIRKLIYR